MEKEFNREPQLAHLRRGGNLTHAGVDILPEGKDIPYIVIEKIRLCKNVKVNGKTEEEAFIAKFAKNPYTNLNMLLNKTNKRTLLKLAGLTGEDSEWRLEYIENFPVRLTKEKTNQMGWGLRISPIPAQKPNTEKQPLTPDNKVLWDQAVNFIKSGNSLAKIKEKYDIPQEIEVQLIKEAQA